MGIMMEVKKMEGAIEAILFALGDSVAIERIAAAIEQDIATTEKLIHNMMDHYESMDRGIRIIEMNHSYQMCTKVETYDYITKVVNQPQRHTLTDVVLETLSIIAYKQPITKQEIESIRGVKCDHAVNKLIEYNLVEEVGRLDAIGRPILFGTTEDFLRCFGVHSVEELPIINSTKVADFKLEAEEEAQLTLDI